MKQECPSDNEKMEPCESDSECPESNHEIAPHLSSPTQYCSISLVETNQRRPTSAAKGSMEPNEGKEKSDTRFGVDLHRSNSIPRGILKAPISTSPCSGIAVAESLPVGTSHQDRHVTFAPYVAIQLPAGRGSPRYLEHPLPRGDTPLHKSCGILLLRWRMHKILERRNQSRGEVSNDNPVDQLLTDDEGNDDNEWDSSILSSSQSPPINTGTCSVTDGVAMRRNHNGDSVFPENRGHRWVLGIRKTFTQLIPRLFHAYEVCKRRSCYIQHFEGAPTEGPQRFQGEGSTASRNIRLDMRTSPLCHQQTNTDVVAELPDIDFTTPTRLDYYRPQAPRPYILAQISDYESGPKLNGSLCMGAQWNSVQECRSNAERLVLLQSYQSRRRHQYDPDVNHRYENGYQTLTHVMASPSSSLSKADVLEGYDTEEVRAGDQMSPRRHQLRLSVSGRGDYNWRRCHQYDQHISAVHIYLTSQLHMEKSVNWTQSKQSRIKREPLFYEGTYELC